MFHRISRTSAAPVGVQPFTWADVYDYNTGDEFHYYGYQSYGTATVYWKSINRVLGKTVYSSPDSVRYLVEICKKTWYPQPPPNTSTQHDTVVQFYNFIQLANDPAIALMPDEFYTSGWAARKVTREYSEYNHRQAQIVDAGGYTYYGGQNCYSDPFESWGPVSWYVPGLGITKYMYGYSDITVMQYNNSLVYFRKGSEVWGTPVATDCNVLTGTEVIEVPGGPALEAFPNPAVSETRILMHNSAPDEDLRYILYNSSGMKVCEGKAGSNPFILRRDLLPSGLYLLMITGMNGKYAGSVKISFK
ncbi:MAG: T9SS type A sorting domain-containing protein [Bacteroidetes bacterium]|nr:T9SS type A sorting domain-containing protein [Bacteroidota bacterium]